MEGVRGIDDNFEKERIWGKEKVISVAWMADEAGQQRRGGSYGLLWSSLVIGR